MPDLKITCAPILDLPRSAEIVIEGGVNATNATLLKDRITASLDRKTATMTAKPYATSERSRSPEPRR